MWRLRIVRRSGCADAGPWFGVPGQRLRTRVAVVDQTLRVRGIGSVFTGQWLRARVALAAESEAAVRQEAVSS